MFLVAVGFWNFLGAGIFGFLINLPIVSYYEIGTALTANHGHAAMMGVYGMLAVGLALFCLRYLIPAERWSDRAAKISFWSLNIGLAWMCFATLFPLGIMQLYKSVRRRLLRGAHAGVPHQPDTTGASSGCACPATSLFIVGGVLPLLYICWLGVRYRVKTETTRGARGHPLHRDHRAGPGHARGVLGDASRSGREMSPPATEASLAAGYAGFLLLAGLGLDLVARHSHQRSMRYRTAGFRFQPDLDAWVCPKGSISTGSRPTTTGAWSATGENRGSATRAR